MPEKIRPTRNETTAGGATIIRESGGSARQAGFGEDLPERASYADIGAKPGQVDGAVGVNVQGTETVQPSYGGFAEPARGPSFAPPEAAAFREEHEEPNRAYGRPYRPTEAEKLLTRYHETLAAHKARYAGTRDNSLEKPFLEAKQALIDAGLMKGDV